MMEHELMLFCIVDYGETRIKWKTTALSETTQFKCGGIHTHVNGCIVGNFETKHKSPNHGQQTAFHCSRSTVDYTPWAIKTCPFYFFDNSGKY